MQRFKDKKDGEGRKEAIKDGLIDGFDFPFQSHELNLINNKCSETFSHNTYPTSY